MKQRRLKLEVMILMLLAGMLIGKVGGSTYAFFDPLVDVHHEISRLYFEEPDQEQMRLGAIQGMLRTLNDPYTDYLSPSVLEEFDSQTRATFTGIGAEIDSHDTGQIVIISPLEDSPAFKAGVLAGDIILEIDGKSAEGLTTQQAVDLIRGPEGTEVTLKVRRRTGEEKLIPIVRQRIPIQTVKGFRRNAEQHWDNMLDRPNGIAYLRVTQFSEPTTEVLKTAIAAAKNEGLKGLILDLRFNPGGLLDQAVAMADLFLNEGDIVSSQGRNRAKQVWTAQNGDDVGDFPMVVLVNEFSASASEIVAGALKDNDRAVIVGTRTFGKGSVQEIHALPGGGAIKVTTALYYLPSGRNLHRHDDAQVWGVDPNDGFYVPMSSEQMEKMRQIRLDSDVVREAKGAKDTAVTPEHVEKELADPQLAAAYRTLLAKLRTGEFEPVGQSDATLAAHLSEKAALERARARQNEVLADINKRLKELDERIAGITSAQAAKPRSQAASPTR